jgi:hypothetical protein
MIAGVNDSAVEANNFGVDIWQGSSTFLFVGAAR